MVHHNFMTMILPIFFLYRRTFSLYNLYSKLQYRAVINYENNKIKLQLRLSGANLHLLQIVSNYKVEIFIIIFCLWCFSVMNGFYSLRLNALHTSSRQTAKYCTNELIISEIIIVGANFMSDDFMEHGQGVSFCLRSVGQVGEYHIS